MTLADAATPDATSDQSDRQHRHRYDRSSLCALLRSPCRLQAAGRRQTSADLSCRMDSSFWMSSVLSSCSCSRLSSLHAVSSREPAVHRLNLIQAMPDRAKPDTAMPDRAKPDTAMPDREKPEQALSLTFMCMKSAHGVKRPGLQVAYSCPACT